MKNKATHTGTCQACGHNQKLPAGKLSKHGYDVKWHFFNGVCFGAGHLPFEVSTDLVERCIANAQQKLKDTRKEIATLNQDATEARCWVSVSRKIKFGYGRSTWEQVDIYERTVTYSGGEYVEYYGFTGDKLVRIQRYGQEDATPLMAATKANKYYADVVLKPRASLLNDYIKWQQERVANWKPSELKPIA